MNGIHVKGGAICAACRSPRPFAELIAYAPLTKAGPDTTRIRYACRPSLHDMHRPKKLDGRPARPCFTAVVLHADLHAIALATDIERLRRGSARPAAAARPLPEHIREYATTAAA